MAAGVIVNEEEAKEEEEALDQKRQLNALNCDVVVKEEAVYSSAEDEKHADLLFHKILSERTDCLVDCVVCDPNHPSYQRFTLAGVILRHIQVKKKKYLPN